MVHIIKNIQKPQESSRTIKIDPEKETLCGKTKSLFLFPNLIHIHSLPGSSFPFASFSHPLFKPAPSPLFLFNQFIAFLHKPDTHTQWSTTKPKSPNANNANTTTSSTPSTPLQPAFASSPVPRFKPKRLPKANPPIQHRFRPTHRMLSFVGEPRRW